MNINHKNLTTEELLHNYEEISNLFYLPYVPMPERKKTLHCPKGYFGRTSF